MIPKLVWAVTVGTPIYLLFYFGLAGLYLVPYNEQYFTYRPHAEIAWLFLVFGSIGIFATLMRYLIGNHLMGKHCELTYFSFMATLTALAIVFIKFSLLQHQTPFALPTDWYWLFGLSTLAGGLGVFLYRLEKGKPIIPKF